MSNHILLTMTGLPRKNCNTNTESILVTVISVLLLCQECKISWLTPVIFKCN